MATPRRKWSKENCSYLIRWRSSLNPLTVDIVGDFSGEELFAIQGEALLAHCIQTAHVDYGYGFQLLHAIHTVESFLSKLSDRGCNFHIIWFDSHNDLCIPHGTLEDEEYKYLLTRAVVIKHFAHATGATFSYRFSAEDGDDFRLYLDRNPLHFFMCSNGGARSSDVDLVALGHLSIGYQMARAGYCVAFIDHIEFRSSKVNASVVTPSQTLLPLIRYEIPAKDEKLDQIQWDIRLLRDSSTERQLTARDIITLCALSQVLKAGATEPRQQQSACILIQLVMLCHCDIQQRSFSQIGAGLEGSSHEVIREFCQASTNILDMWTEEEAATMKWDVFDLIDGRLYLQVLNGLKTLSVPDDIARELSNLAGLLNTLSGVDISNMFPDQNGVETKLSRTKQYGIHKKTLEEASPSPSFVLPFTHPIMDQYLQQVHLTTEKDSEPPCASQIFRELTHWHNAKKTIDPKHIPKAQGFFARKRNQKFMADTIAYSASLTGSSGKIIDPEVIVVQRSVESKKSHTLKGSENDWRAALREEQASKTKKHQEKSGRQKALELAVALKAQKEEEKSAAVIYSWHKWCSESEKDKSLMKRYLRSEKYLRGLSSAHMSFVGAEISLYICHVLNLMRDNNKIPDSDIPGITAMLWSQIFETSRLSLTPDIAEKLSSLAKSLNVPLNTMASSSTRRPLPFNIRGTSSTPRELSRSWEFQLEHCGPYMERSFDSAPDPRVPFHPDAWQRKVLDAIDVDKSLFVVAPTSAGKTFISFYAMKKVLQSNDDDILVYVAPTKALANQIAAEVQARFTKSYHSNQDGRSVWAIHTRDYRVNNPQGCQILITVPHILQIMLLAPSNAATPKSWSRRVRRIIFDEVHCIGQSEDGVIWEQLLLLAPCPIIALSATVGNPLEFKTWLDGTQKVNEFDLEMITHGSRYSDLRKFIYEPTQSDKFQGLRRVERLPFPGLDSGSRDAGNKKFTFIHPIGSLVRKNIAALNDTSLEPRDCLSLWRCMKKHSSESSPISQSLDPEICLPDIIKKSDIANWESALKQQLGEWMLHSKPQFDAVQTELRGLQTSAPEPTQAQKGPNPSQMDSRSQDHVVTYLSLILDLRSRGSLPAIVFNFDRSRCEKILCNLLNNLESAEAQYQEGPEWKAKMGEFEEWKKADEKIQAKKSAKRPAKRQNNDGEGQTKLDVLRDKTSEEDSPWKRFDPDAPIAEFSFADDTKISKQELEDRIRSLKYQNIRRQFIDGLRRGLGVHHAGMNRQYRQVVEILFRKGYLTVVVATGTLALGLNMPCKTVVFSGDSVFLSALQYRQASGRAGRRGFDDLGNVVFHNMQRHRVLEIMSSKLPNLRGQFPSSVTLILRLFGLLHGTNNSEYARNAVKSLLNQNRLYLGGPKTKLMIKHHLRFSIDYLRRQHLLSEVGLPLNFSGLVGHLYYTENSAFAFHSLIKEGYFHKLCSGKGPDLHTLMLVLCHLFCRIPCSRYNDKSWRENVVHSSMSIVVLPELPKEAVRILKGHNKETLEIFQSYVSTYAMQHLSGVPDNRLPFTKLTVAPAPAASRDFRDVLQPLPKTVVTSPFAALSGQRDEFSTIGELCRVARSDVFLEESTIPYIRTAPEETGGVPWNAYLYDFFKHGDMKTLVRDNGIKAGDVWFRLKDFSLILATIVTSLRNFLNPSAGDGADDAAMIDVQDAGNVMEENLAASEFSSKDTENEAMGGFTAASNVNPTSAPKKEKSRRKVVAESWDDEESSDDSTSDDGPFGWAPSSSGKRGSKSSSRGSTDLSSLPSWIQDGQGESLVKVCNAFCLLQEEFDTKLRKVGA